MIKVSILGGGESGIGAALLAKKMNFEVFLSDNGMISDKGKEELNKYSIPFEEKGHSFEILSQAELIVKSPGIPDKVEIVQKIIEKEIEIISEIEFAYRHQSGKIVAITGSNGKTTTTHLIYHLLSELGCDVAEVGNVGKSFARQVFEEEKDIYVVEVSSFQLDGIICFRPDVALLLNISADHLDRYDYDIEKYAASKFRIAKNLKKEDAFIFNMIDPGVAERLVGFPTNGKLIPLRKEFIGENDIIHLQEIPLDINEANLMGYHNQMNLWTATRAVVELMTSHTIGKLEISSSDEVDPKDLIKSFPKILSSFQNDPHRMEIIGKWNGITWVNDSKATNVDAVYYALEGISGKIIWIAGGTDKGNEYDELIGIVAGKVKMLICLGLDNEKLKNEFSEIVTCVETSDVSRAVEIAAISAVAGDTVILSPACASFDLFKNYKDRGDQFKNAVKKLMAKY